MRVELWPLSRIRAEARRRVRDVEELARSIATVGLLQPLVVAEDGTLLAGYHRYLAVRELGWREVPVQVVDLEGLRAELAALEENLVRHELTELERAEHLRRQKEIYEALHPWTRDGVRQNLALTKVESGDEDPAVIVSAGYKGNEEEDLSPIDSTPPFARHVERVAGVDERTVRRLVRIAERLTPETKGIVRGTKVEDNQKALLYLAKLPPEVQPRAARLMVEGVPPRLAAARAEREMRESAPIPAGADPLLPPEIVYIHGDFREGMANLVDGAAALVLTDPPYAEDAVGLYGDVARHAARVLAEGGSLLAYAGQSHLREVMEELGRHLRYWWTLALLHRHGGQTIFGKDVWIRWKPVLWYVRSGRGTAEIVPDLVEGSSPEKGAHPWAQGAEEVRPLIRALTLPGDLVLDPMAGSGAFLWAAFLEGRRAVGWEVDPERYEQGRAWLMEQYARWQEGREEEVYAAVD